MSDREPETEIHVRPDGSLKVYGSVRVLDVEGNPFDLGPWTKSDQRGQRIKLCRCGRSASMPFCDETHTAAGFRSAPRVGDAPTPS